MKLVKPTGTKVLHQRSVRLTDLPARRLEGFPWSWPQLTTRWDEPKSLEGRVCSVTMVYYGVYRYIHTVYVRLNHQFILSFPFPCLHQRLRREITFNKQFSVRLMTSEPNKPNSMRIPMLAIQKTLRTPRKKKGCLVTKAFQTVNPQMAHHKGTTFYG